MKVLRITSIVVIGCILIVSGLLWNAFRTKSKDISHLQPFTEIMGKELTTVQPCFIAINSEHWVKENQYLLAMKKNKFSANSRNLKKIPLGSILKITEAKEYTNGVTGFKSTYVLGTVLLEDPLEEVPFEFAWGGKNYGTDLPGDYYSYSMAPWQHVPLDVMYNYTENVVVPFENYTIKK